MGLLDRLWPRKSANTASADQDTAQTRALVERLTVLSPSLKLAHDYRERLRPALAQSIAYVSDVVMSLPPAREASAASWPSDPYIHAFFAAPDDVALALSRSPELHAWFDNHPLAREVYAVLAMTLTERRVFGVEQVGDTLHSDVAQITLSFDDHLVRVCGESEADLREQIVRRVVEQIALEGIARISAEESRRDALVQERALLKARLQLMTRHGAGTHSMLSERAPDDATAAGSRLRIEAEIDANARALDALGLKTDAIEHELDVICDVLSHPERHTNLEMKHVRLNAMNVVIDASADQPGNEIVFPLAQLPASELGKRAFSLVRFARADLLALATVLAEDSRFAI